MTLEHAPWIKTVLAGALPGAVWVVAAANGYALETIWLPAVAVAAAWPRRAQTRACLRDYGVSPRRNHDDRHRDNQ